MPYETKHIVFLHGWGQSIASWQNNLPFFERNGFTCTAIKLPGFDLPDPPSYWGVPEYVAFVEQELLSLRARYGAVKLMVVGHSFGGRLAIYMASTKPEYISALVLTGAAGIGTKPGVLKALSTNASALLRTLETRFGKLHVLRQAAIDLIGSKDYRHASPTMREVLKNVVDLDLEPYLLGIHCPTLLVWGEKDRVTPFSAANVLRKNIASSQLELIHGAAHFAHVTEFSSWNNTVYRFLVSV